MNVIKKKKNKKINTSIFIINFIYLIYSLYKINCLRLFIRLKT